MYWTGCMLETKSLFLAPPKHKDLQPDSEDDQKNASVSDTPMRYQSQDPFFYKKNTRGDPSSCYQILSVHFAGTEMMECLFDTAQILIL